MSASGPLPEMLPVLPWWDSVIDKTGFSPTSAYVETCYLPVLGPTATWLYRRLGSWAALEADVFTVDALDLAKSVGVAESVAKNSPLVRSIGRLAQFGAAEWTGEELAVRTSLPRLPERWVERFLPPSAMAFHREVTEVAA